MRERIRVQRRREQQEHQQAGADVALQEALAKPGQPLDVQTRAFMEPRFGHSFEGVQVHADAEADALSREFGAKAFAYGDDLFFRSGQFSPETVQGKRLLAHELTHVVQRARFGNPNRFGLSHSSDASEKEAKSTSSSVMRALPVYISMAPSSDVARDEELNYCSEEEELNYCPADLVNPEDPMVSNSQRQESLNYTPADPSRLSSIAAIGSPISPSDIPTRSIGWRPDRAPHAGPYLHGSVVQGTDAQIGLGLLHEEFEGGGKLDVMSANANLGVFGTLGRDMRIGGRADAQMFQGSTGDEGLLGADGGVFGANAEMSVGEDGATIGAQASIINGAVRAGELNRSSSTDLQARFGLSAGPGLSGRLHWGDRDGDGHREYGFGFDGGPFSADFKTEDPLRSAIGLSNPMSLLSSRMLPGSDVNLTDSAIEGVSSAVDWAGDHLTANPRKWELNPLNWWSALTR